MNRSGSFETWVHGKEQSRPDAGREIGVLERRGKTRVSEPFPTTVSGIDEAGESFELDCVLDNISSNGLYLRIPREMKFGAELSLVIKFLNGHSTGANAILLAQVLRDEPQPDGHHGLALAIKEHHFL